MFFLAAIDVLAAVTAAVLGIALGLWSRPGAAYRCPTCPPCIRCGGGCQRLKD